MDRRRSVRSHRQRGFVVDATPALKSLLGTPRVELEPVPAHAAEDAADYVATALDRDRAAPLLKL
jgi:hypothetical protein